MSRTSDGVTGSPSLGCSSQVPPRSRGPSRHTQPSPAGRGVLAGGGHSHHPSWPAAPARLDQLPLADPISPSALTLTRAGPRHRRLPVGRNHGHFERPAGLGARPSPGDGEETETAWHARGQGRCGGPGAKGHRPAVTGGTALREPTHQGEGGQVCHREGDHDVASVHDRSAGGPAASRPACRGQPCTAGRPDPTSSSRRSKACSVHHRGTDLCPPSPRDGHPPRLRSRQLPDLGNASPNSR